MTKKKSNFYFDYSTKTVSNGVISYQAKKLIQTDGYQRSALISTHSAAGLTEDTNDINKKMIFIVTSSDFPNWVSAW